MRPRIVLRTHYQVDEPAILRSLITQCTSPTRTEYAETIADRLAKALRKGGWDFNAAAGRYAIDLARATGLLTDNLGWTARAHLLSLFADRAAGPPLTLSLPESLALFAIFFDTDGAAILLLSQWLERDRRVPAPGRTWNEVANNLVIAAYVGSMPLIEDLRDRTLVRHILERRKREPFKGRSGEHQGFVHAQAMHRLGLCDRQVDGRARIYLRGPDDSTHGTATGRLVQLVPSLRQLEDAIRQRRWSEVAARVMLRTPIATLTRVVDRDAIIDQAIADYRTVVGTGVALCPLDTLIEAAQIRSVSTGGHSVTYRTVKDILTSWQRLSPRTVRFHVDRRGDPAFVKMS